MTNNLARRLQERKSGHTITTSKMNNFTIVYKEEYNSFDEARKIELQKIPKR